VNLDPYRAFMIELAERSGEFIRPFFGAAGLAVETKADNSPVTEADTGAERLMREMIAARFPSHGIIGEEHGYTNADAEFVWVLDPIDGTKAFAAACPLFGTLVALLHQEQPVLGMIHQPILHQLMLGDGKRTTLNEQPVRVRSCSRVEDAVLLTSDPFNPGKYRDGAAFDKLARRARVVRTWGDCYGYLLVASGWADVMLDPIMNPWDVPALVPILRGAGGKISDWYGKDAVGADSTVAAHPLIHADVIAALNPSSPP
jgi:histidinol phosphatase-like enzyme (inositol monophosphatase family)